MLTRRVSVEEVQVAYAVTGFIPKRADCALCALAAVIKHQTGLDPAGFNIKGDKAWEWVDKNLGWDYACGFMDGFDTEPSCLSLKGHWIERKREGYMDGVAVAVAMFGEVKTVAV